MIVATIKESDRQMLKKKKTKIVYLSQSHRFVPSKSSAMRFVALL
jgi:hypothetical protein